MVECYPDKAECYPDNTERNPDKGGMLPRWVEQLTSVSKRPAPRPLSSTLFAQRQ